MDWTLLILLKQLKKRSQGRLKKFSLLVVLCSLVLIRVESYAQVNTTDSIYHQGDFRTYIAHTPPGYSAAKKYPLVFILHGGTGNASGMLLFTLFNSVADTADFIAVYPQGTYTGLNIGGKPGHHWADGRKSTPPDTAGIDDVLFFKNLIDTLNQSYSIDSLQIFATGISNGGFMVQNLACNLSGKIAAVASVAATFPDSLVPNCSAANPVSILFINGTEDSFVPTYTGGAVSSPHGGTVLSTDSAISYWINKHNCLTKYDSLPFPDINNNDSSTVTSFTAASCSGNTEIWHYKVYGGGHTWPQEFFHVILTGPTNEDINASSEIWNFFKKHPKQVIHTHTKSINSNIHPSIWVDPTTNDCIVKGLESDQYRVRVYGLLGSTLSDFVVHINNNETTSLPINNLQTGIYLIHITNNTGLSLTQKVFIR